MRPAKNPDDNAAKKQLSAVLFFALVILAIASPVAHAEPAVQSSNLAIEIPPEYADVNPGGSLLFTIRVFNLATKGRIDVVLENSIINSQGRVVLDKSETVAVETQASFVRNIAIPSDLPLGKYTLQTRLIYADGTSTVSESHFEIDENQKYDIIIICTIAGVLVLLIVLTVVLSSKVRKIMDRLRIRRKIHNAVRNMLSGK
jgi:hypothetical protein